MTNYSLNPKERKFRKFTADLFEAFLGPKDPRKFHIAGVARRVPWLD